MKCERCGHELDNDDLFCSKCGKAVFEEYMDDDDIWEFYKSDEELKAVKGEAAAAEEKDRGDSKAADPLNADAEAADTVKADDDAGSKAADSMSVEDTDELPNENPIHHAQKSTVDRPKKEKHQRDAEKKSPIWLISGCILLVCLLIGILWGVHTMQQMDEEKKAYYTKIEQEDKTAGAKADTENKQDTAKKETDAGKEPDADTDAGKKDDSAAEAAKDEKDKEPEKEPEKEPKKEEYFKLVDADSIDFSKFQKVSIPSVDQNSQQSSENYDYSAASAVDGDIASSWQEGEEGLGEGTGIRLDFDKARKVRYMVLYLGNWRSENMWEANARAASLTIRVGDSQEKDVEFSNERKAFCLSFDEPVEASYVSLYIKSGYEGDRWNDNCISEVEIYE